MGILSICKLELIDKSVPLYIIQQCFRSAFGFNADSDTDTDTDPAFEANADPDPDLGF
jgi:hypothetical protein